MGKLKLKIPISHKNKYKNHKINNKRYRLAMEMAM